MTDETAAVARTRPDWDQHFMAKAELNSSMSTCLRRGVGAVAVRDKHQIADGFNGNLPGAPHCVDGACRRCSSEQESGDLAGCVCVHAETNLVAQACRLGVALSGSTVYCTTRPCLPCYLLLSSAGVACIVYHDDYPSQLPSDLGAQLILFDGATSKLGSCSFPGCTRPPTLKNRTDNDVCLDHRKVIVSQRGSEVDDSHLEGGHG
jgi:dCMP deaminase